MDDIHTKSVTSLSTLTLLQEHMHNTLIHNTLNIKTEIEQVTKAKMAST
jgi:hypothetical protein